jgi:glycosidase
MINSHSILKLSAILLFILGVSCQTPPPPAVKTAEVQEKWSENSTIYEVNLRQMTKEGTFKAFQEQHLDRLADLGVEILWFMPIHPIGKTNRKGTMGSYYSVQNYQAVNPQHGSMDDFKALVNAAHAKGMKVIIDWVANHTSWDHVWIAQHPDWFTKDSLGNFIPPVADWSDVMDLNYDNLEMREAMVQSLEFWIKEANIDGYRCDVAEMVPLDFWVDARARLDSIRPIFFLAEGEKPELHQAFDMTYAWSFHHLMKQVAKGEKGASDVAAYWAWHDTAYNDDAIRMQFISNHDENSWNNTIAESFGANQKAFAVLSFTVPGMPLIYSGMEADLDKRLKFFDKDTIAWKDMPLQGFYKSLVDLKANENNLRNDEFGGSIEFHDVANDRILLFTRTKEENRLLVALNFTADTVTVPLETLLLNGSFKGRFSGRSLMADSVKTIQLPPHGYEVYLPEL